MLRGRDAHSTLVMYLLMSLWFDSMWIFFVSVSFEDSM